MMHLAMKEHVPMQLMKAVWRKSYEQWFGHTTHMQLMKAVWRKSYEQRFGHTTHMQLMKAVWGKSYEQWFGHSTHVDFSRILPHYSGIMLVARISSLFQKLCQHNGLKPSGCSIVLCLLPVGTKWSRNWSWWLSFVMWHIQAIWLVEWGMFD